MKNICIVFSIIMLLFIFMSGCSSLPAPRSETDTLLVIPMESQGPEPYFDYSLWFKWGDKEKVFSLRTHKNFGTIHGLKPGKYTITHIGFYQSGDRYKLGIPVELKPGTLHIAPFVVITITKSNTQYLDMKKFEFKDRVEFLKELQKNDTYDQWEIDYQVK